MSTYYYTPLLLISFVCYGISVPPEYCLHPLNKNDCHGKPRRVFTYYQPGSRCDIEVWRGCPTMNMFADEFSCSDMCIGVMYQAPKQSVEGTDDRIDGDLSRLPMFLDFNEHDYGPCHQYFNDDDCGESGEMKYFFSGDLCVRTEWKGCKSPNLFNDLQSCIKLCHPITYFKPHIKEAIATLNIEEVNLVDKLIEDAINQETIMTELPVLSETQKQLPKKKRNDMLLKMYNLKNKSSMEEEKSKEKVEVPSDREQNYENEEKTLENKIEDKKETKPEPLALDYEEDEGSLEEVFTLD